MVCAGVDARTGVGHGRESFCPCCARRKTFPSNTVTRAANTPRSGPVEPGPHVLVGLSSQQHSGASEPLERRSGARNASEPTERARPDSPKRKVFVVGVVPRKRGRAVWRVCRCGTGGISWRSSWSRESGAKCSSSAKPPPVLDRQKTTNATYRPQARSSRQARSGSANQPQQTDTRRSVPGTPPVFRLLRAGRQPRAVVPRPRLRRRPR